MLLCVPASVKVCAFAIDLSNLFNYFVSKPPLQYYLFVHAYASECTSKLYY